MTRWKRLRWLALPPAFLLVFAAGHLASPEVRACLGGCVVLASSIQTDAVITVENIYDQGQRLLLWKGRVPTSDPIILPRRPRRDRDGHLRVQVREPGKETIRMAERGYVTSLPTVHYIFITKDEILYAESAGGWLFVTFFAVMPE